MTDHYYTENPETPHQKEQWSFELKNQVFHFETDTHVFSRKTIDYGTRVLIDTFNGKELPEGDMLDVGCGYGPIGLTLASVTGRFVEMVDVNQRAIGLAKENAKRNHIKNVDIHYSNIYDELNRSHYAAIISNPPIRAGKTVVHNILSGAHQLLESKGTLTVVIRKKQGAPSAEKKMKEVFGNVEIVTRDKGYYVLRSTKG